MPFDVKCCPRCNAPLPERNFTIKNPYKCECGAFYKYRLKAGKYFSARYEKWISWGFRYPSDGATGWIDIHSKFWKVHDVVTNTGEFDDGTPLTNRQASNIAYDILKEEGRDFLAFFAREATFWCGGYKARENGMFRLNKKTKLKYGIT